MDNLRECTIDLRVMTQPDVVEASRIVVDPGCYPCRIVLREKGKNGEGKVEYAVSKELLRANPDPERKDLPASFVHLDFIDGTYTTNVIAAEMNFRERSSRL